MTIMNIYYVILNFWLQSLLNLQNKVYSKYFEVIIIIEFHINLFIILTCHSLGFILIYVHLIIIFHSIPSCLGDGH
jgi:hypothetical protein